MGGALLTGLGLAAPAGLNAFLPLLIVALAGRLTDLINLGRPYHFLASTPAILLITLLLTVEVVLDKIPGVDHLNDLVQYVLRPAAGAIVMMAATRQTALNPVGALLIGLAVAGAIHVAKARLRPGLTMATGGIANPLVSLVEDGFAALTAILALLVPALVPLVLLALVAGLVGEWRWVRGRLARDLRRPPATGPTPSTLRR